MTWSDMIWFALPAVALWISGAVAAMKGWFAAGISLTAAGLIVFGAYIVLMWVSLERPPLRTMGETRLWYSFFLPLAGVLTYSRWKYRWILGFSTILSVVFVCVNLFKPEIHNKTLMPALQSPWFAPHVIVYMFAYAMLGAATLVAIYLLLLENGKLKKLIDRGSKTVIQQPDDVYALCDNLVYVGLAFMTIGMLFGALWAKEAWGHYWSWDPKETWAAITWLSYLTYIHCRIGFRNRKRLALFIVLLSFVFLQMCWWGVNYLPAAQGSSIHTYNV